jgi:hypothetical protein
MIPAPADVASPPADATITASGLATKVLEPGTGTKHPTARSKVLVHYSGWTTDGKMFDRLKPERACARGILIAAIRVASSPRTGPCPPEHN